MRRIIRSSRLRLRRVTPQQARAFLAGRAPPGATPAAGYPTSSALEVFAIFAGDRRDEAIGFTPWFIVRAEDGCVIGEIAYGVTADGRGATVSYGVVPSVERQGYATEALRALVAYLLAETAVDEVEATTFPAHVASRRVMEKVGMRLAGERIVAVDGRERTVVVYRLRRR